MSNFAERLEALKQMVANKHEAYSWGTRNGENWISVNVSDLSELIQKYEAVAQALDVAHIGLLNCIPMSTYDMNTLKIVCAALPAPPEPAVKETK